MTTTPALNDDLVRELNASGNPLCRLLLAIAIDFQCDDEFAAANTVRQAASALEAQAKEIEALKAALEPFVNYAPECCFEGNGKWEPAAFNGKGGGWYGAEDFRRARTALTGA